VQAEQVRTQPSIRPGNWQGTLQPPACFLEESARQPEAAQCRGQTRADLDACGQRPVQRGAEVVVLAREDRQVAFPLGKV
jgi:hypothetical protein